MSKDFKLDIFKEIAVGLSKEDIVWEEEPVDVETFIEDKHFLNQKWNGKTGCRPKIKEYIKNTVDDNVRQAIWLIGKGCLAGDTLITLADGKVMRMDKLYKKYGNSVFKILNVDLNTNQNIISKCCIKYSGKKELYKIILEDGQIIKATENHKFPVFDGVKKLKELKVGDSLLVSKNQNLIKGKKYLTKEEARFLGYIIGDGCTCIKKGNGEISNRFTFTNGDINVIDDYIRCVKSIDKNCIPTIVDTYAPNKWGVWCGSDVIDEKDSYRRSKFDAKNCIELLKKVRLYGKNSATKRVPNIIKKSTKEIIGEFLVGYWMTDGECNTFLGKDGSIHVYYAIGSKSKKLVYDVRDLLLRIGVYTRVRKSVKNIKINNKIYENYTGYHLEFSDNKSIFNFSKYIKLFSNKGKNQDISLKMNKKLTTANIEFLPKNISKYIRDKLDKKVSGIVRNVLTGRGKKINIDRYEKCKILLNDKRKYVDGDVHYVEIKDIIKLKGKHKVYDITVICGNKDNYRNYIANGIISCNSGKDFGASIIHLYGVYKLLCMYNPQRVLGLADGTPIYFINVARNEAQARNVFFRQFLAMLENCLWFKGKYESPTSNTVKFNKNIVVLSGNSQAFSWLGYNTIQWVGDELAFFLEKDNNEESASKAEECWEAAYGSCQTRFPKHYKMIGITTPRFDDDFVMQKFRELQEREDGYAVQAATWDVHPNLTIQDFEHALKRNYRRTMRDFGAQPMGVIESFWADPLFVDKNVCDECKQCLVYQDRDKNADLYKCRYVDCRINNYKGNGEYRIDFVPKSSETYYCMHFDLAKNKDKLGFALGHIEDIIKVRLDSHEIEFKLNEMADRLERYKHKENLEVEEYVEKPVIKIDAIGFIDPASDEDNRLIKNGEIHYHSVLKYLILELINRGFNLLKVTFDQFQSLYLKQQLVDRGIESDLLSLDRTDEVPVTAKRAFIEGRVIYPYDKLLCNEAKKLLYIKGKKVDHPKERSGVTGTASKDVWDAVAGTIYNLETEAFETGYFLEMDIFEDEEY